MAQASFLYLTDISMDKIQTISVELVLRYTWPLYLGPPSFIATDLLMIIPTVLTRILRTGMVGMVLSVREVIVMGCMWTARS